MARRIDADVVSAAVGAIARTAQNRSVCSLIESFLVFRRLDVLGCDRTIAHADQVCIDLFVVLPDDENGRLYLRRGADGRPFWGKTKLGARGTVWNVSTRPTGAGLLFDPPLVRDPEPPHSAHPFRSDVLDRIVASQTAHNEFVPIDALAALVLRDAEVDEALDWDGLIDRACELFDQSRADIERITGEPVLSQLPLFAGEPWEPDLLPDELRPLRDEPEVGVVADRQDLAAVITLRVDERTRRMIRLGILSTSAVLLVGPPGTGKTTLLAEVIHELRTSPELESLFGGVGDPVWRTPDDSWTSREVVGGPTVMPGSHDIRFMPGLIPRAIEENRWVVLDEINRGDADRIFGPLITWLSDRPVEIGRVTDEPDAAKVTLDWSDDVGSSADTAGLRPGTTTGDVIYRAGRSWRLLGTYNAQDAQRVFRFGQALGRRFQQVPIPAMTPVELEEVLDDLSAVIALPPDTDDRISALYRAHYEADVETRLGPAQFLKMRTYVGQGVSHLRREDADDAWVDVSDELIDELVAEAYLVNVGERLARLDSALLEAVRGRAVEDLALSSAQWEWLQQRLADLS